MTDCKWLDWPDAPGWWAVHDPHLRRSQMPVAEAFPWDGAESGVGVSWLGELHTRPGKVYEGCLFCRVELPRAPSPGMCELAAREAGQPQS